MNAPQRVCDAPVPAAWRGWGITLGLLTVAYGLLMNPYWARGGDSEAYLGIARNLVAGEGFTFNTLPVAMVQPGWPWLLAGVMSISGKIIWIKLLSMLLLLGFCAVSYRVLLRYVTPGQAAVVMLLVGFSPVVVPLSYLAFSDVPMALCAMAAVLLGQQIREGRDSPWRIGAMLGLCVLAVLMRHAAVLTALMAAGALVAGEVRPRWNRRWIAAALAVGLSFVVFLACRYALQLTPEELAALNPLYNLHLASSYELATKAPDLLEYLRRLSQAGGHLMDLLSKPLTDGALFQPTLILGWLLLVPLSGYFLFQFGRRSWVWGTAAFYGLVILILWPFPPTRYFLPIAPFLLAGLWVGLERSLQFLRRPVRWPLQLARALVLMLLAVNAGLWGLEVWVARSGEAFRQRYEAGLDRKLTDISRWLRRHAQPGEGIAISAGRFKFPVHGGKSGPYFTDGNLRTLHYLTALPVLDTPDDLSYRPGLAFIDWTQANGVRYYVFQPPRRLVLHFRDWPWALSPALAEADMDWRLYKIHKGKARQIEVPDAGHWPTRVPMPEQEK